MLTSRENPLIKLISALKSKKGRIKHRLFLAEGPHLVREAMNSSAGIKGLICEGKNLGSGVAILLDLAKERKIPIYDVAPKLFKELAETESPQGIMALVTIPEFAELLPEPRGFLGLILNGIQDPGNVGTILRTAWAAGITDLFLTPGTADPYSGKAVRSSQGGIFYLRIHNFSVEEIISWSERNSILIWAADPRAENIYYEQDFTRPGVFLLGNEARGPEAGFAGVGIPVRIPLPGRADSLNVSTSAAILVFEALRQRSVRINHREED